MTWQPIETAPKDGTRILGYSIKEADDLTPQIMQWLRPNSLGLIKAEGWHISWDHTPCDGSDWVLPPTHWCSLPDPLPIMA